MDENQKQLLEKLVSRLTEAATLGRELLRGTDRSGGRSAAAPQDLESPWAAVLAGHCASNDLIRLEVATGSSWINARKLVLGNQEFTVLLLLARAARRRSGKVTVAEVVEHLEAVDQGFRDHGGGAVEVHKIIHRLKKKLGNPLLIEGRNGYRLSVPGSNLVIVERET